jgi:hypothetical protein
MNEVTLVPSSTPGYYYLMNRNGRYWDHHECMFNNGQHRVVAFNRDYWNKIIPMFNLKLDESERPSYEGKL